MANTKRGRPADVIVSFDGGNWKVEPHAFTGLSLMVSRNDTTEAKKDALLIAGARKIEVGETFDLDNLDKQSALQIYNRRKAEMAKADSGDEE